jgi:hypothetical protein
LRVLDGPRLFPYCSHVTLEPARCHWRPPRPRRCLCVLSGGKHPIHPASKRGGGCLPSTHVLAAADPMGDRQCPNISDRLRPRRSCGIISVSARPELSRNLEFSVEGRLPQDRSPRCVRAKRSYRLGERQARPAAAQHFGNPAAWQRICHRVQRARAAAALDLGGFAEARGGAGSRRGLSKIKGRHCTMAAPER